MPFVRRTLLAAALGGAAVLLLAPPRAAAAEKAKATGPPKTAVPSPSKAAPKPAPKTGAKTTTKKPSGKPASAAVPPSGAPLPRLAESVLADALAAGKGAASPGLYRLLATTRGLPEAVPGPERGFLMTPRMRVAWFSRTAAKNGQSPKPADVPARVAEDSIWLVFWPVRAPYVSQGVASFDQELPVSVRVTATGSPAPIPASWASADLSELFSWFEYGEAGSLVVAFSPSVLATGNAFVVTYRCLRSDGEHELDVSFAMSEKDVAKWK